jgi:hypothetical protein
MKTFFRPYRVLLLIVLVKLLLQFILVNPVYELHRDEFLHLDQASHLALGFISLPPLTSLFARVIFLFGGSLFMVRLVPAIFGALTIVFAWLITEILGGRLSTRVVVALALLFSPLIRINILFQPNSFDILIWTILFYFFIKYIKTESNKWLYLVAVAASIAFYNKYMIAFLLVGLLAGILLTSRRKLFAGKNLWLAVIIGLILISPNLLWQAKNHFPVIRHMQLLKENQLDNNTSLGFIISQVKILMGSLPLTLAALAAFIFYKPFKPFRVIGICFVTVFTLLTIMKGKDYYSLGLYPVILAFGAVYLENLFTRRWNLFVVPGLIIINLIPFVFTLLIIYPVLSPAGIVKNSRYFNMIGALRWEDGKNHTLPQDFADMLGWKEMADKSLEAYNKIPASEKEYTLIFCDNYGQTGALNYYNRGKMPEAYSFSTDYIFWLPKMQAIHNILLVGDKPDEKIIKLFSGFTNEGGVENPYAREKGTSIYLMSGADTSFTRIFYRIADEKKSKLDIF